MDKSLSQERISEERFADIENYLRLFGHTTFEHACRLVDEVKRLQAIEAERDRYEDALQEILWYPQGNALVHVQAIKKIADNSLKGADTNESN
jgi:hypothetical protein